MSYALIIVGIVLVLTGTAQIVLGARMDFLTKSAISSEENCKNLSFLKGSTGVNK